MNFIALGSRIRGLRKSVGLSQEQFADKMGVSQNIISRWERGEVEPKLEKLDQIALLGGAEQDIHWLVTGRNLLSNRADSSLQLVEGPHLPLDNEQPMSDDFILLPLYDVMASAGAGSYVDREQIVGERAFSRSWLRAEGLVANRLTLIMCKGDSMEPTLKSGDTLMIDHSITTVTDDAIYTVQINQSLMVKRLQRLYDGAVLVQSDNPIYESQRVPASVVADTLDVIGRVVWVGRRLL